MGNFVSLSNTNGVKLRLITDKSAKGDYPLYWLIKAWREVRDDFWWISTETNEPAGVAPEKHRHVSELDSSHGRGPQIFPVRDRGGAQ